MKTDDLIAGLAADNGWRTKPVWLWLLAAMIAALPLSGSLFMVSLGMRPDIATAVYSPFFDFKFVITIALASAAAALSLHLSRPEASLRGWIWLLAVPAGLLGIGIAADFAVHQRSGWVSRLTGTNSMVCMTSIPLLSLPLLAAALLTLRRGATTRPAITGTFAGLMSGGVAATLYAMHCGDDSPLFVATWYTLGFAMIAAIGALAGRRLLRF
jgi:hypothetical protein